MVLELEIIMGFFNINEYEPVAARLDRFWIDHKMDGRIETELISHNAGHYIVHAKIFVNERLVATGLADEHTEQKGVNARNALENCESSAIGRGLSNFNYSPKRDGKSIPELRPSREEMVKANVGQSVGAVETPAAENVLTFRSKGKVMDDAYNAQADKLATAKQINYLRSILDTHLGVQKRLDDTKGHNGFVRFALKNQDKRILPECNLTFADVKPLFDDHKSGLMGDNITAWLNGIPESHMQVETDIASDAHLDQATDEDDPWKSPEF